MIKYALVCVDDHDFESWFPDSAAFEQQVKRGFVTCPVCQTQQVSKAVMSPAITARRGRDVEPAAETSPAPLADPREALMREKLRQLRQHIVENTEDVGRRFPEEARLMHEGEIEHRPISGQATPMEARELIEDGVQIMPVPFFPDDRH